MAERIRLDRGHDDAVGTAGKLEALQLPDGCGAFPRLAVGPEILESQQLRRALVEQPDVEPFLVPECGGPAERVPELRSVRDPVAVAAPERGEPRVETLGRCER